MASALDGIRVVDFGQYIFGPLAGMLLADQGADVIKIDPPNGPLWDTPANATWNRGKKSITLDIKNPEDLEIAKLLVDSADVLIENFRPGVMERLKLGHKTVSVSNKRLIFCSLPGFAADDPRASLPGWEGVVSAAAGAYRETPGEPIDKRPIYTALPISSSYSAFLGATSITMALNARERDGIGQHIEVPMYDATFTASGDRALRIHNTDQNIRRGGSPWVRQYQCADNQWIMLHGSTTRFISQFARAANVESWQEDQLLDRSALSNDPQLNQTLHVRLTELFKTRSAPEWEELINGAGTPATICRETQEWLEHPHARATEMIIQMDDPQYGVMLQPGVNPRLELTPGAVQGPAPELNGDRETILADIKTTPTRQANINVSSSIVLPALDGIKVLDLCIILAGPICGRTLAEFGADVIKIDNPNREGGVSRHNETNRGKRSMLIDLITNDGLELFYDLVDQSDVVVQNFRTGVAERLGIGYEDVRKRKPSIIYTSLNAYGHGGTWDSRPGWEQLAQAATGMQRRFGGKDAPALQQFPINDCGTGVMGAYGVALALLHRKWTGEGQHIRSSLSYTGCTIQAPFLHQYGKAQWSEPQGQDMLGTSPLHRAYKTRDRWIFIGAKRDALAKISTLMNDDTIPNLNNEDLEVLLEKYFLHQDANTCITQLNSRGIAAQIVKTAAENLDDPWAKSHNLSMTREHTDLGLITTAGPAPRLSRTPINPGHPAPKPGSDASNVMQDRGLAHKYDRLVDSKVIVIDGVPAR
jgi:crotonobetainyl-CoA:carnitine CoA-transferase CaiB-like acyl-CoA transferase